MILVDFVSTNASEATRRATARDELRAALSRAYTFVQSRHQTALALVRSVDDFRNLELEQLEGPLDSRTALITHVDRRLSDKERVEEVRNLALAAIESLRSNPDLEVQ